MTDTDTEKIRGELDKMGIAYTELVQAAQAVARIGKCTCKDRRRGVGQ